MRRGRIALLLVTLATAACGSRTALDVPADGAVDRAEEAVTCGPGSCNGCCDDAGACQSGDAQALCGEQGRACVACLVSNDEICNPQPGEPDSRVCWAPCDPRFCLRGCCLVDGTCVLVSDTACGDKGHLCIDCTATGQTCGTVGGVVTCR